MLAEGGEIWIGKGFVLDGQIVEALGMTDEVDCWYDSVFIRQCCWLRVHAVHLDRVCCCCCVVVLGLASLLMDVVDDVFLGRGTCLAGSGLGVFLQSLLTMGHWGCSPEEVVNLTLKYFSGLGLFLHLPAGRDVNQES